MNKADPQRQEAYDKLHALLAEQFNTTPFVIQFVRGGYKDKGGRTGILDYIAKQSSMMESQLSRLDAAIKLNRSPQKQQTRIDNKKYVVASLNRLYDVGKFLEKRSDYEVSEMCRIGL